MVILYDRNNLPEDIYKIVFATDKQRTVAKLLIKLIKNSGGTIGKADMSMFATKLHEGKLEDSTQPIVPTASKKDKKYLSYNKRQFYDRILTPMKSMGLIDYDLFTKKYSISDTFNKVMIRLGIMWLREVKS
ncbi:MAG: hypothetical protein WC755_06475 [Candidatus Woesearchaeota archaeon]|jgi:hypothetical protein